MVSRQSGRGRQAGPELVSGAFFPLTRLGRVLALDLPSGVVWGYLGPGGSSVLLTERAALAGDR